MSYRSLTWIFLVRLFGKSVFYFVTSITLRDERQALKLTQTGAETARCATHARHVGHFILTERTVVVDRAQHLPVGRRQLCHPFFEAGQAADWSRRRERGQAAVLPVSLFKFRRCSHGRPIASIRARPAGDRGTARGGVERQRHWIRAVDHVEDLSHAWRLVAAAVGDHARRRNRAHHRAWRWRGGS